MKFYSRYNSEIDREFIIFHALFKLAALRNVVFFLQLIRISQLSKVIIDRLFYVENLFFYSHKKLIIL